MILFLLLLPYKILCFSPTLSHNQQKIPLPPIKSRAATTNAAATTTSSSERNIDNLQDWAIQNGIAFIPGLELEKEKEEDSNYGVKLKETETEGPNSLPPDPTVIMTIPPITIISSAMLDPSLKQKATELLHKLGRPHMKQYLPELSLFILFLQELDKGSNSRWYPWIQCLPKTFDTGLHMDEFEHQYAKQIGMEMFLNHQMEQWESFQTVYRQLFPEKQKQYSSAACYLYTLKWAFSVVFTRSWTTSYKVNGESASVLVPLGDMFNHNSAKANVKVVQDTPTSDVTLVWKDDNDYIKKTHHHSSTNQGLYINYGFPEWPARFIFTFGFLDTSSPYIFSNITFDTTVETSAKGMGFTDTSKMVFYTEDGAISDWTWLGVLYKVLLQKQKIWPYEESLVDAHKILFDACVQQQQDDDPLSDDRLVRVFLRHQQDCVIWMKHHLDSMLETVYGPLPNLTSQEYQDHPRLVMLVEYHEFMREVHQKVRDNLPGYDG